MHDLWDSKKCTVTCKLTHLHQWINYSWSEVNGAVDRKRGDTKLNFTGAVRAPPNIHNSIRTTKFDCILSV